MIRYDVSLVPCLMLISSSCRPPSFSHKRNLATKRPPNGPQTISPQRPPPNSMGTTSSHITAQDRSVTFQPPLQYSNPAPPGCAARYLT